MSNNNKEFYDLLNSITNTETFNLTLTDNKEYTFKQLSTSQLRDLIKTVVDSPLTQAVFNSTVSNIMKDSLVTEGIDSSSFTVVDRLLFILETRIQSISPFVTVSKNGTTAKVDLNQVKKNLTELIVSETTTFSTQTIKGNSIEISYGVPTISTELQLNEEYYKNYNLDIENQEELRKILGDTFINEITKTIQTVNVQDKLLVLSTVSFEDRRKTVESLPASLINSVIEYIEKYRKILDQTLVTESGINVPIDGTLFSLR